MLVTLGLVTSCSDDSTGSISLAGPSSAAPTSSTEPPSTTAAAAPTTTTSPLGGGLSYIANIRPAVKSVTIRSEPNGPQLQLDTKGTGDLVGVSVPNPLPSGAPTKLLLRRRSVEAGGSTWSEVMLPVRPNGSTGWINDEDITVTTTELSAVVTLSEHRLDLLDGTKVIATYPVAVGTAENPTPTGSFFVKELVAPQNGNGSYGPIAYGMSAFSPTLVDTEAFADGVIGIHGTNKPELIGTDVSHGCVRMKNEDILDLQSHDLPLGMPVRVRK